MTSKSPVLRRRSDEIAWRVLGSRSTLALVEADEVIVIRAWVEGLERELVEERKRADLREREAEVWYEKYKAAKEAAKRA